MKQIRAISTASLLTLVAACSLFGQATDGNLTGTVLDPSGAAVTGATVTAEDVATGVKAVAKSDSTGTYRVDHLLIGTYAVTASATGFTTKTIDKIAIELNKTSTVNIKMEVGNVSQVVEVSDTATAIDTTTAQVANTYNSQFTHDLAVTANANGGILNLSLLGAGVGSNGGIGVGQGPSIGGQRPRNNNFTIEGIDNNRKDITGPVVSVPNDAISEFTLLQNQFSAEYGHSSGGQFNSVLDSGTNKIHGAIWEFLQNRNLDSIDQNFAFTHPGQGNPRYDQNRLGAKIGGPIIKNKLFYFGSYEYNPLGQSASAGVIYAPTAAGYSTLGNISTLNQANLGILKQYLPAAPSQASGKAGTMTVCDAAFAYANCPATNQVAIPVGNLPVTAPNFQNLYRYVISVDYNLSDKDQLRGRYIDNKTSTVDTNAELPVFFVPLPVTGHLGSFSEFHNFSPAVNNEFRISYNRYNNNYVVPGFKFPGLDQFPNVQLLDLGPQGLQLGPDPNAPQATIQNTYSLVDNVSWVKGRHEFKFGIDARDLIAASTFIQRARGDYEYTNTSDYLHDMFPNYLAQRNVGGRPYSGNQTAFYAFANDNYKVSSNLTLNMGVRYEFNGVAQSMQLFNLDSAASTPGIITFAAPKSQKTNFAPRLGFAYTPGTSATTSIRGGFGLAYDQIFDNVGTNATPPQASATVNSLQPNDANQTGYLANGGILPTALAANPTVAQLKTLSTNYLPNQEVGYAINWNLGVQHVFAKDYTLEVRYLGNRGVHLLFQNQLNKVPLVTASTNIPYFFTSPSAAVLNSLPLCLSSASGVNADGQSCLETNQGINNNKWYGYGYTNAITGYLPIGNSSYEGLATELTKRFSQHLTFKAAYTWSHLIDDSTAEVNSTALTPRRPEDFQNISQERATSALDHRNRFTLTSLYQVPWFAGDTNWIKKNILGNFQFSFVYTGETGELATPQSGTDSNLNGDSAGDRVVINPNGGFANSSSDVTKLTATSGPNQDLVVGYLVNNPYALYIRAQPGMYATSGRNILATPAINNLDFNASKVFSFRERMKFELRADFFNGLNHPQFTAGAVNNTNLTQHIGLTGPLTPGNSGFDLWSQVFSSHPRVIQVGAKLDF